MHSCVRGSCMRKAKRGEEKVMMGEAMQRAIDTALRDRGEREATSPDVVDATASVPVFSLHLMCEARIAMCIRVHAAVHIHEPLRHERANGCMQRLSKGRRTRRAIQMSECLIQITEYDHLLHVVCPLSKFGVQLLTQQYIGVGVRTLVQSTWHIDGSNQHLLPSTELENDSVQAT